MSLLEVVLAMSIALSGALGLNLAWSQSFVFEQQLAQAREARSQALSMLYQWQQNPTATDIANGNVRLSSQALNENAYAWQLEFSSLTGTVQWQGVWAIACWLDS